MSDGANTLTPSLLANCCAIPSDFAPVEQEISLTAPPLYSGTWAWPSDLSYYVKFYHIKLDRHFIEHVEKNGWTIQNKNDIDLLKLEF